MLRFEFTHRDGAARLGRLTTDHGVVRTPTLLPVINPNLPLVTSDEMRKMGVGMVITNSYIIRKKAELRERALKDGVHRLIDWTGPVMTDSGTFQQYVYGDRIDLDPLEVVDFQRDIGVDVGTALDVFSTPERTFEEARADVEETVRRVRASAERKGGMALAATVQGSVYPELRTRCAELYRDAGADIFPIGGVVPLMERQRYGDLAEVIVAAKRGLDPSKPVHLFGAGHPMVFPLAAWLGCDLFDSSAYAKYADDGRMIFPEGTKVLADMEETWCTCASCGEHGVRGLKALPEAERKRALALHNLHVTFAELARVREAVREGSLGELVEERCRTHPSLVDGFRAALRHSEWLETKEPLSKPRAFFALSAESLRRPEVVRARKRLLTRFDPAGRPVLVLDAAPRPWSESYANLLSDLGARAVVPAVRSMFGPVPLALDAAYPFAQSVEPQTQDRASREDVEAFEAAFGEQHRVALVDWTDRATLEAFPEERKDAEIDRLRRLSDWQFGPGAGDILTAGEVRFVRSPNTGKWRNVLLNGEHVLSLRAPDGLFTLKIAGAVLLHRTLQAPRLRLVVARDSVEFNRQGKSVFAKFALDVDEELRPGDECLVVDEHDALVACGVMHLAAEEVGWFETGVAATVREGLALGVQGRPA